MLNPLLCFLCILNYVQLFLIHHNRLFIIYFWVDPLFCVSFLWIRYSVQLFWYAKAPKQLFRRMPHQQWNFYSGAMIFLWVFKSVAMTFHLGSCAVSKGCLWDAHGIKTWFPWEPYWIPMVSLLDFYDLSLRVLYIRIPKDSSGIWHGFLWIFYNISMGFLKDFYFFMTFLLNFYISCLWYSCGIYFGFLKGFHDISFGFQEKMFILFLLGSWISMKLRFGFRCNFYEVTMGLYWIPVGLPWYVYQLEPHEAVAEVSKIGNL